MSGQQFPRGADPDAAKVSGTFSAGQGLKYDAQTGFFLPASFVKDDDSRLSDAREPTAHAATHAADGDDAITPEAIGAAAASHTHSQSDIADLEDDLGAKAPLDSPALTGSPTAPTPSSGDNDTSIATTAFVKAAVDGVEGGITEESDPIASAALETHEGLTTTAHGGIVADDDSRLTDARTPTAHASSHATGQSDEIEPSDIGAAAAEHTHEQSDITGLSTALGAKADDADLTAHENLTTTAHGGIVADDDSRLSDDRDPTAHADSHKTGGSDALAASDIGAAAASHTHSESDITDLTSDLAAKAPLASPTFTGTPKAPTASAGTNTTQLATTAFVKTAVDAVDGGGITEEEDPVASAALETHEGLTENVHGIADTADLATTADLAGKVDDDDSRLTDARTPTSHASTHHTGGDDALAASDIGAAAASHTHEESDIDGLATSLAAKQSTSERGQAGGYASLDSSGLVPTSQIPAIAINSIATVASQTAQLALTAEEGDIAVRSDLNKAYVHNGGTAGTMADWTVLPTPADQVLSVNGQIGVVNLDADDVDAQPADAQLDYWAGVTPGDTGEDLIGADSADDAIGTLGIDLLPAGMITQFGGESAPDGWLLCDGSAVSRTTYADLFAAIGTLHGEGNGSTTFNVPDFTGRYPRGKYSGAPVGFRGGASTVALGTEHLPAHTHQISANQAGRSSGGANTLSTLGVGDGGDIVRSTTSTGSGHEFDINPPNVVVYYIIKT